MTDSKMGIKWLANVGGTGSAVTIALYCEGANTSRVEAPLSQAALEDIFVKKSTYNANTILAATSDDTPVALTVTEQTLVGRITSGNIAALSIAQDKTLLGAAAASGLASLDSDTRVVESAKTLKDADGDTKVDVEESSDEDKIRMDVAGTEAFYLSDVGILTLAKQAGCIVRRETSNQIIPGSGTWTDICFNAEDVDTQNEFDSSVISGTADATEANKLHDDDGGFSAGDVGKTVWNKTDNTYTTVSGFVDSGELDLTDDIMVDTETYDLFLTQYTAKEAGYYFVNLITRLQTINDQVKCLSGIIQNSTYVAVGRFHQSTATSEYAGFAMSAILSLSASDTIKGRIYHADAGNKNLNFGAASITSLTVIKIV